MTDMDMTHRRFQCRLFAILLLFCLCGSGFAQDEVRLIPKLEPTKILIGEQTTLSVSVVAPADREVQLALPADTLVSGVEILGVATGDTTMISDRLRQIVYEVTLTSFDSASYTLDHIAALVADQPVEAQDQPILMVGTVPVDLEHPDEIRDIKPQWLADFVLWDYLYYVALFYALMSLIALLFVTIAYFIGRQKEERAAVSAEVTEPLLDPYEEAVEELAKLKDEKLWESDQVKEYYTEMSDILRRYLKRVYGFETGEKTSSEILELFRSHIGRERMYDDLSRILTTADLAKFAKYRPEMGENVGLLSASRAFVEEHKPKADDKEKKEDEL
nr:hypothetical protein [uncultured Porphyromonas sp.]